MVEEKIKSNDKKLISEIKQIVNKYDNNNMVIKEYYIFNIKIMVTKIYVDLRK